MHGFLLAAGVEGDFTPIDFPGAPNTVAFDINNRGQTRSLSPSRSTSEHLGGAVTLCPPRIGRS